MTHAWLFTGPPGSGRSIAARAFAAALQCTTPTTPAAGTAARCTQVLHGTHTDVAQVVPEGLSLSVREARAMVEHGSRRPTLGRWLVTLVEDADRMTDDAANAMLKAVEEPPPRGVLLLCAPSAEDLLPTIRSRCRLASLRTPSPEAVAGVLVRRDGVDPAMAAFAARAAQGHIGRARRLATDEGARRERQDVLALVRSLGTIGSALAAAQDLVDAATEEAGRVAGSRDAAEKEELSTALGAGATGKGLTGGAPRGGAGALKELETRQKRRSTRTQRDALDRALVDLTAFYRDVLTVQLGTGSALIHGDLGEQAAQSPAPPGRRRRCGGSTPITACRAALDANVAAAARRRGDGAGPAHRLSASGTVAGAPDRTAPP